MDRLRVLAATEAGLLMGREREALWDSARRSAWWEPGWQSEMREDAIDRRRIADHRQHPTSSPTVAAQDIDQEDAGEQDRPRDPFRPEALGFGFRFVRLAGAASVRCALGFCLRLRHDLTTTSGRRGERDRNHDRRRMVRDTAPHGAAGRGEVIVRVVTAGDDSPLPLHP